MTLKTQNKYPALSSELTFILLTVSSDVCQIAHHYELLIIEDDPYYFLQFNKVTAYVCNVY